MRGSLLSVKAAVIQNKNQTVHHIVLLGTVISQATIKQELYKISL